MKKDIWQSRKLGVIIILSLATMQSAFGSSVCRSPNDVCMNSENHRVCQQFERSGCTDIAIKESCPLQFVCGESGFKDVHVTKQGQGGDASVLERRAEDDAYTEPYINVRSWQKAAIYFFVYACAMLSVYIIYLHRELAKLTMYRILGLSSPLLSQSPDDPYEQVPTDGVELTFSAPEIAMV